MGKDYRIRYRYGKSVIAVIAPHGGGIEPGTAEIADAVAGSEHHFYSFEGLKQEANQDLHIPSILFDEPVAIRMVSNSETVLAIHGCKEEEAVVYVGGRDQKLLEKVRDALVRADFVVKESPRLPGRNPQNICNRSSSKKGVQLEITSGLRCLMFKDLPHPGSKTTTKFFHSFVRALRGALDEAGSPTGS